MKCPKCKSVMLQDGILEGPEFPVKYCPECMGFWIPSTEYDTWVSRLPSWMPEPEVPSQAVGSDFVPSPYDTKAGLCPESGEYLSRARIGIKRPFYVERSSNGIWLDSGEWEMLESLGLHCRIHDLFSPAWQARVREKRLETAERQAIIDKLGEEVAQYVFELARILEDNPNGDCAAAYILRRFEAKRKQQTANSA